MKVDSNVEFDKTINLPAKTIKVNSDSLKEESYLLEKIKDQKKYKMAISQNSSAARHYDITDMPIYVKDSLEVTEVVNKILKDIIVRNKIVSGSLVNHNIFAINSNNLLQDIKENDDSEENGEVIKQRSKKSIFVFANVKERERANNIVKARIFTKKKLEEKQRYQLEVINRLGTLNDYSKNFSSTLKPEFEERMLDKFFSLYQNKKIYKENKPVYWCPNCKSSSDHVKFVQSSKKVAYVMYRVKDDNYLFAKYSNLRNTYFIGTTISPWIMVHSNYLVVMPDQKYSLVEVSTSFAKNHYIILKDSVENVMKDCGVQEYNVLEDIDGEQLKWCRCQDPLDYTKNIAIIGAKEEYVAPDRKNTSGIRILSNCHSYIDYLIYTENRLEDEMKNILDMKLKTSNISSVFKNMYYKDAEANVIDYLKEAMFLLGLKECKVKSPKCEICDEDLVYRFVNEWYIKKDNNQLETQKYLQNLRDKLVETKSFSKDKLDYYLDKIYNMNAVQISEEKLFGVPIPIFYCGECGNVIINDSSIECIKKVFKNKKVEEWYKMTPEDILQRKVRCDKCSCDFFFKEEGVLNDFFKVLTMQLTLESEDDKLGKSEDHNIIVEPRNKVINKLAALSFDDDISIEVDKLDKLLVHGISDNQDEGLKLNRAVNPKEKEENHLSEETSINAIVNKYGMDVLRLWVSHKYINSRIVLKETDVKNEKYKYNFLRLTFKYLISNLKNFNPSQNYVEVNERTDLDKYMQVKASKLHDNIIKYYENLEINKVYDEITKFCISDMCRTYFDSIKYRLYILKEDDKVRLSTLSTMYDILLILVTYLEPITPFLIEEIFPYIWFRDKNVAKNILLLRDNFKSSNDSFEVEYQKWDRIFKFKAKMKKILGRAQKNKIIGNTLQAKVIIHTNANSKKFMDDNYDDILRTINVSNMVIEEASKEGVKIEKAEGMPCARCKNYAVDIGRNIKYRYLCPKCADIMESKSK